MSKPLVLDAIRGSVLGISAYRGFARLSDLARISQPDVYDQEKNPKGTQRDLNRRHAREAYEYVKSRSFAFFPEVVLHARETDVLSFHPFQSDGLAGQISVDVDKIKKLGGVVLSRVDGNHRLFYADGHDPAFPPLDQTAGFCIIYDLPIENMLDGELLIFRDINANQKGMNTSHLDNIALRTQEHVLKREDPVLFIAEELMNQEDSPFHDRVYRGGVKPGDFMIPLRNLKTSVEYMRQRSKILEQLDPEAQAQVIKLYWQAVRLWLPEAWENPRKYIVLRSTGFWAMAFIGSDVIDRVVTAGKFSTDDMLDLLRSGKNWDWSNEGDFRGFGGRDGAVRIANQVTKEFVSSGPSIAEIEAKLRSA
jgi:DGQHR domain-containing protein